MCMFRIVHREIDQRANERMHKLSNVCCYLFLLTIGKESKLLRQWQLEPRRGKAPEGSAAPEAPEAPEARAPAWLMQRYAEMGRPGQADSVDEREALQ